MDCTWDSISSLLSASVIDSVKELKFDTMTPVQAACIPQFLRQKDLAVEAVTGSGKTLAFVIPMLEMLLRRESEWKRQEVGAIILTPTRELAIQINDVLKHFLKRCHQLTSLLAIGGQSASHDISLFQKAGGNILVATPGRLEDLFSRKLTSFNLPVSVKSLEVLILDEADRLLDMGFEASINTILGRLPKLRRTGLFSATLTDGLDNLIRAGLRNPLRITVKEKSASNVEQRTPTTLSIYYMIVDVDEKFSQLVVFVKGHQEEKMLLFFSTCACVDYFSKCLQSLMTSVQVLAIHGRLKQKRNKIFARFRSMTSGVMLCTNVMARGIDIPDVDWVIQYDPPSTASDFVHRCGRTARIGNPGSALVMLLPAEDAFVEFIRINQKVPMTPIEKCDNAPCLVGKLQTLASRDRAIFVAGMRAYVSFIQSYIKHQCSLVFRLKDLHFGRLATAFGLLTIPKMPELKGKVVRNFSPPNININSICFRDKAREKLRQQQMKNCESKKHITRQPKNLSWSKQKERRSKHRDRKKKKRERKKASQASTCAVDGQKGTHPESGDIEYNDFGSDIRLIKKLKRGKISKEDFARQFIGEAGEHQHRLTDDLLIGQNTSGSLLTDSNY